MSKLATTAPGGTGMEITRVGSGAWAIGAIVGFRSPAQVRPLLPAAGLMLTGEDIAGIGG